MTPLRKVLVVDDDPVVGRSFERVLSGKGYAVITARDGEEALRKLSAEAYDVVFTDIKMPGMSGLEVAERVKASQPWLPVVIVTGYGTEENEARAEAAGVAEFLRKPLSPEAIEGSAAKVLQERVERAVTEEAVATVAAPAAGSALKNVALFFAAPLIGLAYLITFPLVALGMLAWMGAKALLKLETPGKLGHGAIEGGAEKARLEKAATAVPHEAAGVRPAAESKGAGAAFKNVALFFAAPFIGLAYIITFPLVALGMLAWMGGKALMKYETARKLAHGAKAVGMFVAAPFIGLAYIVVVPVAALVVLAWMGAKALFKRPGRGYAGGRALRQ
jgi:CheY-like chemotaxis protein